MRDNRQRGGRGKNEVEYPYGKKLSRQKKTSTAIELSRLGLLIFRRIDVFNQLCEIIWVEH